MADPPIFDPDPAPTGDSGSSGSGPAAPARDSYISDLYDDDAVKRQKATTFAQVYQQLWGEPATEEYLMKAVSAGFNVYEFALQERSKPAWTQSKAFKDAFSARAAMLKQLGV